MTSSDDDDGRNGHGPPPGPFRASPTPPAMSPLTPATRSAAASVVHENNTPEPQEPQPTGTEGSRDAPDDRVAGGDNLDVPPLHQEAGADAEVAPALQAGEPSTLPAASTSTAPDQHGDFLYTTGVDSFNPYAMSNLVPMNPMPHNMSLMMALANLSASQINHVPPTPTVVTPAQVSLPTLHDGVDMLAQGSNGHQHAAAAAAAAPLESFARIEFADSVFQMTTYAVIVGRDQRALEQARRDEKRAEEYQRRVEENAVRGLPPPSPPSQERGKFSKSYVSEEGGMLGPESDGDENPRPAKRRKADVGGSASGSNSQPQDPATEEQPPAEADTNLIINRQYVSHTPGAAAVDLASLRPSPYHVPFIAIHSPGPGIASKTKAISREHLKIEFNQKAGVFEAIPLHKNGFFCEDIHYKEEKAILHSGDRLQIKDVEFAFIINGVAPGKTGAEEYADDDEKVSKRRYSEGGKEMSFDFESSHAGEVQSTSSDEEEEKLAEVAKEESASELSDVAEDDVEDVDDTQIMETIEDETGAVPVTGSAQQIKPEPTLDFGELPPMPPKKRGPGRPPKNGIMSKREERLRKKQAMELLKQTQPQPPPGEPPVKRKVGRPRKHPRPEEDPDKPEKRKYKPRKPKGEDGQDLPSDGEKPPKEKRREKPKTPPLELRKEDFTEEQLQKPNKNYGVLIDEVLTEAAGDGLTLKQIYKRIQKKYPYYYFVVDTKGWESSVRHNLIGNDAFKKNEETHLWRRVPGIELDAGKKRKAPSPDQTAASLHHGFGQHYPPQIPHPGMYHRPEHMTAQQGYQQANSIPPPAGYPPGTNHQQPPAGSLQQQQFNGVQAGGPNQHQQPPRPPYPVPPSAAASAQPTGYGPPAPPRPIQLGAQGQQSSYNSPYASKPPPAPTPPTNGVSTPTPPVQHGPSPQQHLQTARAGPTPQFNPQQQRPTTYQTPGPIRQGQAAVQTPATQQQPVNQAAGPASNPQTRPPLPPSQPAVSSAPTPPLEPPVKPDVVSFINNFKKNVMEHLSKRTEKAEAVTLSVINRGLGLTDTSIVPEEAAIEKVVLNVFEQTRDKAYPSHVLSPGLVTVLKGFKTKWVDTLGTKLGKAKAEALLLSAIDRFLGFSERTILQGGEKERREYEQAEDMLIPQLRSEVTNWQRGVVAGGVSR